MGLTCVHKAHACMQKDTCYHGKGACHPYSLTILKQNTCCGSNTSRNCDNQTPRTCDRRATPCYTLGPYLFPIKSSLDSANRFSTQHTLRVLHNTHSMCCTPHKLPLAMCFQGSVHRGEVQPQGVPQSASLSPRITHRVPQRLINVYITCASANSLHILQGATAPHLCCCCPPGGSSLAHTVPPMTHKQAATTDTPLAKHTLFSLVAGKGWGVITCARGGAS